MPSDTTSAARGLLDELTGMLRLGGIAEPRREAVRLWNELADPHLAAALVHPGNTPDVELAAALRHAARRRAAGEPFAYVVGRAGFRHLVLRTDRRALIPRPETEGLVDLVLARVRGGRAADIGTGTGALALSLATEGAFTAVVGVESSSAALALAAENRRGIGGRIDLVLGDLCGPLGSTRFDALVANPPYLSADEYAGLDPSVRAWEPAAALVSGPDGLEATGRLLDQGRTVLRPGGWMALEVDCRRADVCARRAAALGWSDISVHADLFGRDRYLLARRSATS